MYGFLQSHLAIEHCEFYMNGSLLFHRFDVLRGSIAAVRRVVRNGDTVAEKEKKEQVLQIRRRQIYTGNLPESAAIQLRPAMSFANPKTMEAHFDRARRLFARELSAFPAAVGNDTGETSTPHRSSAY